MNAVSFKWDDRPPLIDRSGYRGEWTHSVANDQEYLTEGYGVCFRRSIASPLREMIEIVIALESFDPIAAEAWSRRVRLNAGWSQREWESFRKAARGEAK